MRTVTFSEAAIVKSLNQSFVCAWTNKRPSQKFKDGIYADKPPQSLPNGTAPDNVTSVFAAWDGTVIHAMSGSLDVDAFKKHLAFAQELHGRIYEGVGRTPDAEEVYAKAHREAGEKTHDYLARKIHLRMAKELSGVRQWYPTLFEMLFGAKCED